MSKTNKCLISILLLSFSVSIIYPFYFKNKPTVDAKRYDAIAMNLISGNGYRIDKNLGFDRDGSIYLVGPGYEFFLAGAYYLLGHTLGLIWFLHALMLVGSAFFAYHISQLVFKDDWQPIIGLSAAALVGLSPDLILVNSMILSEPLGIFLMLASVFLFLKYLDNNNVYWLVGMSLVSTFAVMTRPVLLLLVAVYAVVMFVARRRFDIVVFFFVGLAFFVPWIARNWSVYHTFIPSTLAGDIDLWWGNHKGASGELDTFPELSKIMSDNSPAIVKKIVDNNAKQFILNNPLEFGKLVLKRISIYFSFIRPTGWWPYPGGIGYHFSWTRFVTLFLSALYSAIIFVLGISGIWQYFKNKSDLKDKLRINILFWATILMPLSVIFIFVESRYRYPIYPFMAIFGGYFLMYLTKSRPWYKNRILLWVVLLLGVNSIIDIFVNIARIKERV